MLCYNPAMSLNLYRRHYRVGKCIAHHRPVPRNYEPEELRRSWRKCHCPIYACGTLGGKFRRKNTESTSWEQAKAVALTWEKLGCWEGNTAPAPVAPREPAAVSERRITLDDAAKIFLSLREGDKIAPATLRKYRTFTRQLLAFATSQGYVMLDQLTSADVDKFYSGLKLGVRAKAKRLGTLRFSSGSV